MADSLLRVAMAASSNGYHTLLRDGAVSDTITAATFTATPMNTTTYDPMTMATVANPAKITVDVDGYYIAIMRTSFLGTIDGTRSIAAISVNRQGAGFVETLRGSDLTCGGVQAMVMPACGLLKLLAGDAVEGVIWTSTGASTTAGNVLFNTLELFYVGPS